MYNKQRKKLEIISNGINRTGTNVPCSSTYPANFSGFASNKLLAQLSFQLIIVASFKQQPLKRCVER